MSTASFGSDAGAWADGGLMARDPLFAWWWLSHIPAARFWWCAVLLIGETSSRKLASWFSWLDLDINPFSYLSPSTRHRFTRKKTPTKSSPYLPAHLSLLKQITAFHFPFRLFNWFCLLSISICFWILCIPSLSLEFTKTHIKQQWASLPPTFVCLSLVNAAHAFTFLSYYLYLILLVANIWLFAYPFLSIESTKTIIKNWIPLTHGYCHFLNISKSFTFIFFLFSFIFIFNFTLKLFFVLCFIPSFSSCIHKYNVLEIK